MDTEPDWYDVLGVAPTASDDLIKVAYRHAAKRCHPDVSGGDDTEFKRVAHAYEVLSTRRATYDADRRLSQQLSTHNPFPDSHSSPPTDGYTYPPTQPEPRFTPPQYVYRPTAPTAASAGRQYQPSHIDVWLSTVRRVTHLGPQLGSGVRGWKHLLPATGINVALTALWALALWWLGHAANSWSYRFPWSEWMSHHLADSGAGKVAVAWAVFTLFWAAVATLTYHALREPQRFRSAYHANIKGVGLQVLYLVLFLSMTGVLVCAVVWWARRYRRIVTARRTHAARERTYWVGDGQSSR